MSTPELDVYRQLQRQLLEARQAHEMGESEEEDAILDRMDVAWSRLGAAERAALDAEPPAAWPDAAARAVSAARLAVVVGVSISHDRRGAEVDLVLDSGVDIAARRGGLMLALALELRYRSDGLERSATHRVPVEAARWVAKIDPRSVHVACLVPFDAPIDASSPVHVTLSVLAAAGVDGFVELGASSANTVLAPAAA